MVKGIEGLFPRLRGKPYQVTSPEDPTYNCVAWAVGEARSWWWPTLGTKEYWPAGHARVETVAALREAFASLGYVECVGEAFELGYERVAIFADREGFPTHAARQLLNGRWTSKLGELEDIEHQLADLAGDEYGSVVLVMKRPVPDHV